MSLFLSDQKLGSHSGADSSSHKFMLKGRQSGGMHRGHSWVFRAESFDTMIAWFEDIRNLTEKTGAERKAFIRQHARSVSAGSHKAGSVSSEGLEEDEADAVPYSAAASQVDPGTLQQEKRAERPNPGGRFPSALNIHRDSQVPLSPSSPTSSGDRDVVAAAGLPGSGVPFGESGQQVQTGDDQAHDQSPMAGAATQPADYYINSPIERPRDRSPSREAAQAPMQDTEPQFVTDRHAYNGLPVQTGPNPATSRNTQYENVPAEAQGVSSDEPGAVAYASNTTQSTGLQPEAQIPAQQQQAAANPRSLPRHVERHDSQYGDWMAPAAAAGLGGAAIGAAGVQAYRNNWRNQEPEQKLGRPSPPAEAQTPNQLDSPSMQQLPAGVAWASDPTAGPTVGAVLQPISDSPEDPFGSRRPSETPQPMSNNAAWVPQAQSVPLGAVGAYNDEPVESRVPDTVAEETQTPGGTLSDPLGHLDDPAAPIKSLASRPPLESRPSATTISGLHVPGEFPKTSAA